MWSRIKWWARFKYLGAKAKPLATLAGTITSNAAICAESMENHLNFPTESENELAKTKLLLEFTWAFIHITSRYALGFLGPEKALPLLRELVRGTAWVFVDIYFGESPANLKEGMEADFLRGAAEREKEYGQCRDLLVEGKPFSDDAVLSRLAMRVAEVTGNKYNPGTISWAMWKTVRTLTDSRLNQLVEKATKGF